MTSKNRGTEPTRYHKILERIFFSRYTDGAYTVDFTREEMVRVAAELGIELPKNLGDVVYSVRYRTPLPESIRATAPADHEWIIRSTGRARYRFQITSILNVAPSPILLETKVPDATPGVIAMHAFKDEQALLAKIRYNHLIDILNHWC